VRRRGWEIFGLAFLFRFQAYLLNPSAMLRGLFKVDILNIMGPSIVAAAALWPEARTYWRRLALFAGAAIAITLLTPPVRATHALDWLPDVLEWYIRRGRGWAPSSPGRGLSLPADSWASDGGAGRASFWLRRAPWRSRRRGAGSCRRGCWWLARLRFLFRVAPRCPPVSTTPAPASVQPLPAGSARLGLLPLADLPSRLKRPTGRPWPVRPVVLFVYWVHDGVGRPAPLHKACRSDGGGAFLCSRLHVRLTAGKNGVRWWKGAGEVSRQLTVDC
jgi:hypothetical protein